MRRIEVTWKGTRYKRITKATARREILKNPDANIRVNINTYRLDSLFCYGGIPLSILMEERKKELQGWWDDKEPALIFEDVCTIFWVENCKTSEYPAFYMEV